MKIRFPEINQTSNTPLRSDARHVIIIAPTAVEKLQPNRQVRHYTMTLYIHYMEASAYRHLSLTFKSPEQ
jgi:hypothetical protein